MKDIFGQGIKEPLIHIKNIIVYSEDTNIMGKNLNSWKVIVGDGYAFVNFNVDVNTDSLLLKYRELTDEDVENGVILYQDSLSLTCQNTPNYIDFHVL